MALKNTLNLGFFAAALVISSMAHATDLSGTWTYVSQTCASGAIPNASVEPPNGTITVVQNNSVTINTTMNGCSVVVGPVSVAITDTKVTPAGPAAVVATCPSGTYSDTVKFDELTYTLSGDLVSLKSPPEQNYNGACSMGDSQVVTYRKTN